MTCQRIRPKGQSKDVPYLVIVPWVSGLTVGTVQRRGGDPSSHGERFLFVDAVY